MLRGRDRQNLDTVDGNSTDLSDSFRVEKERGSLRSDDGDILDDRRLDLLPRRYRTGCNVTTGFPIYNAKIISRDQFVALNTYETIEMIKMTTTHHCILIRRGRFRADQTRSLLRDRRRFRWCGDNSDRTRIVLLVVRTTMIAITRALQKSRTLESTL